jgi:hypothetical protein
MKGGIASGVVYPYAIGEIAASYRLRSIGGTSAGAIAAAAAAAAEYGRGTGGYDELTALPGWLGSDQHLPRLFQPQKATRALHRVLMTATRPGRGVRTPLALLRRFPVAAVLGCLPGVVTLLAVGELDGPVWLEGLSALAAVLLLLAGALVCAAGWAARTALEKIPENLFGLCTGMPTGSAAQTALTPWLTDLIDRAAGLGSGPLTFGHLWDGPPGVSKHAASEPWLRLEMVATNVTNHRAERLPSASREYFYSEPEFRRLFPSAVVDWLVAHPSALPDAPARRERQRLQRKQLEPLRPMPDPRDLPVVVATRMSLSFPVLLSAVPLWRVDWSRAANADAQAEWDAWRTRPEQEPDAHREDPAPPVRVPTAERCWFSDGGISSNFPVHFFDTPLPRRPSFAINLRPFHPDDAPAPGQPPSPDQTQNVWMPERHGDGIADWWYRFDGRLAGFLVHVVRTMQNRVDDAQMRVPGHRDRVVHVSMASTEGGLNLDMPPEVVAALTARGRWAGVRLVDRFSAPPTDGTTMSWNSHRWVRLRSASAAAAALAVQMADGYAAPAGPGTVSYPDLLEDDTTSSFGYPMNKGQREAARELHARIASTADGVRASPSLADKAPRPVQAFVMASTEPDVSDPDPTP